MSQNKVRDVEFLLKTGHDVNEKMKNWRTALHIACELGLTNMVPLLLHYGASVSEQDDRGMTPLHIACYFRHSSIVRMLIDKGANVLADSYMGTPILTATIATNSSQPSVVIDPFDVVSQLIEHGANVNDRWKINGLGPIHFAVNENNIRLINLLISSEANVNESICQFPLLSVAVERNFVEVIRAFTRVNNLDVNLRDFKKNTALHIACGFGRLNIVKLLVERGFDINAKNIGSYTPLHLALANHQFVVAEYLLTHETINVNIPAVEQLYPVHTAIVFADHIASGSQLELKLKVIKAIIDKTDHSSRYDREVGTFAVALIMAARDDEIEVAKYLILKGADVNGYHLEERHNRTAHYSALHAACEPKATVETVKLLLSHGAKVNNKDNARVNQPLAVAIQTGNLEKIKELLNHGAQIDEHYVNQNLTAKLTCLSGTEIIERNKINELLTLNLEFLKNVRSNKHEEVKENIKAGASVNVSSARCGSALIYASWKGFEEIVDNLLDNGANVNFKSQTGYTSLHMACRFHSDQVIARKLLRHGAYYNLRDDKKGKTPCQHSREGKNNNLHLLLKIIDRSFQDVKRKNQGLLPRLLDLKLIDKAEFNFFKIIKNVRGENLVSLSKSGDRKCEFLRNLENVLNEDVE